jgi:hypothetical protein
VREYVWGGVVPYVSNGTTECVTAAEGPYPFPTDVVLPTRRVGQLDSGDPRGLSYCYDSGHYKPITDDLVWSLFNGTILGALHNESNCIQTSRAWAPVSVAMQATFLLETTTDFIDEPRTKATTPSASTKTDPTPTDVLVDPFRIGSQKEEEQTSSRSVSDIEPNFTVAPASPTIAEPVETKAAPSRKTSATRQSLQASASSADQSSPQSKDDNESKSSESRDTRPTTPADGVSESQAAEPTASANEIPNSGVKSAAVPKTSQLEILNSLIQDVGQHQSSSSVFGPAATASNTAPTITFNGVKVTPDSSSEYVLGEQTLKAGRPAITISGTEVSLASGASAIVVGSSTRVLIAFGNPGDHVLHGSSAPVLTLTANSNSASEYVVGDQTIKPGGPAITLFGTPINLDSQATAVVVGSNTRPVATILNEGVRSAGIPASRLTLAGTAATLNSASEYVIDDQTLTPGENAITVSGTRISLASHATAVVIGSTTSALAAASLDIGDYVWDGVAGVLEASESRSTTTTEASETRSGSKVVVTSTASDGEIVVKTIFTAESSTSSLTDSSIFPASTSSLASGESSSTPSSSSGVASVTKPAMITAVLVCWMGFLAKFGIR